MTHHLQKGANLSLNHLARHIQQLHIKIIWQQRPNTQSDFDIDASAFMLTAQQIVGSDEDFIFYNQTQSNNGAVELTQQDENSSVFKLALAQIPHLTTKIVFALTLHEAKERQQDFSLLQHIVIQVVDDATHTLLVDYMIDDARTETAMIVAEVYRYQQDWKFKAIGQGYADGLDKLAKQFGVDIGETAPTTTDNSSAATQNKSVTVDKYIEAIRASAAQIENKIRSVCDENNDLDNRCIVDAVVQGLLGYHPQDIKNNQRIPGGKGRADYVLLQNNEIILVIDVKPINQPLHARYVSQAAANAYYLKADFALLTNGVDWQLFYIKEKHLRKYDYHPVFAISLLPFNDYAAECLFQISRFGVAENSLNQLRLKMEALSNLETVLLVDEVIAHIAAIMNQRSVDYQVNPDEVRQAIQNSLAK